MLIRVIPGLIRDLIRPSKPSGDPGSGSGMTLFNTFHPPSSRHPSDAFPPSMTQTIRRIITCEHAGNEIPAAYRHCFKRASDVLNSHRGYDPGAALLFEALTGAGADFSIVSTTTRLLVELNRSLHHPRLFSAYTRLLPPGVCKAILDTYYHPYRNTVADQVAAFLAEGHIVRHVSVHTFTPVLDGVTRNADIGLLYDPQRKEEKTFCTRWKAALQDHDPSLRVRFNYPYRGRSDGFTTFLRRRFPAGYTGVELEVNQRYFNRNANPPLVDLVRDTLQEMGL